MVAEKVYNNQEPPEDKQARAMAVASSKQTRDLARILLATTADSPRNETAVSGSWQMTQEKVKEAPRGGSRGCRKISAHTARR